MLHEVPEYHRVLTLTLIGVTLPGVVVNLFGIMLFQCTGYQGQDQDQCQGSGPYGCQGQGSGPYGCQGQGSGIELGLG